MKKSKKNPGKQFPAPRGEETPKPQKKLKKAVMAHVRHANFS